MTGLTEHDTLVARETSRLRQRDAMTFAAWFAISAAITGVYYFLAPAQRDEMRLWGAYSGYTWAAIGIPLFFSALFLAYANTFSWNVPEEDKRRSYNISVLIAAMAVITSLSAWAEVGRFLNIATFTFDPLPRYVFAIYLGGSFLALMALIISAGVVGRIYAARRRTINFDAMTPTVLSQ